MAESGVYAFCLIFLLFNSAQLCYTDSVPSLIKAVIKMKQFSRLHPVVLFFYFCAALGVTMFCLNPAMLLIDTTAGEFVVIIVTSVIGMYAISSALEGYMLTNINPVMRVILLAAGLMLIYPGTMTDIIGIVITVAIFAIQMIQKKRAAPA